MNCFRYYVVLLIILQKKGHLLEIHSETLILIDEMIPVLLYKFKTFHKNLIFIVVPHQHWVLPPHWLLASLFLGELEGNRVIFWLQHFSMSLSFILSPQLIYLWTYFYFSCLAFGPKAFYPFKCKKILGYHFCVHCFSSVPSDFYLGTYIRLMLEPLDLSPDLLLSSSCFLILYFLSG